MSDETPASAEASPVPEMAVGKRLADEPTGNLDTKTGEEIMDLFARLHEAGHTLLVVTHEEDIARHTHRAIRLRDGRIESDAPLR